MNRLPPFRRPRAELEQQAKRTLLAANELFRGIGADVMAEVEAMTTVTTCAAGQRIIEPNTTGEALFFLKAGRVQLYRLTPEGKRLIIDDVKPGSFFGEMSVLGQAMAGGFAEAIKDSLICAMSRSDVLQMLERHPSIALRVIERLGAQLQDARGRLETMAYQNLEARLAHVLLQQCAPGSDTVHDLTQQDLAEMVGASRESVTRLLAQMNRAGLVEVKRRKIRLLNEPGLRALTDDAAADTTAATA